MIGASAADAWVSVKVPANLKSCVSALRVAQRGTPQFRCKCDGGLNIQLRLLGGTDKSLAFLNFRFVSKTGNVAGLDEFHDAGTVCCACLASGDPWVTFQSRSPNCCEDVSFNFYQESIGI